MMNHVTEESSGLSLIIIEILKHSWSLLANNTICSVYILVYMFFSFCASPQQTIATNLCFHS